jgi:hypothetical protein
MKRLLILVVLSIPGVASAADTGIASQSEVNKVKQVRVKLDLLVDLEKQGVLNHTEEQGAEIALLTQASGFAHKDLKTRADLDSFLLARQDFLTKATNLVTFTNIMLTLAALMFVVAVGWLIGLYFLVILMYIPKEVYEILLYAVCVTLLTTSDRIGAWVGLDPIWFVFPACLGLFGALWVTYGLHIANTKGTNPFDRGWLYWGNGKSGNAELNFTTFSSLICMVVWGAVAVLHQSELIAFISTMALMSFLGFSFFVAPFCIGLGYDDEDKIARTTFAAFLVLMVGVATRISGLDLGKFQVFAYSFIWLGTLVYFCSLLIVANKWYSKDNYWLMTVVTLASGLAALYLGSVYDISVLQKMGGTFFFIWLIEKYFEIPWGAKGAAWAMLLGAILLYFFASFAQKHPDYFLFNGVSAAQAGVSHVK